jgi:hypothetical protein
MVNLQPTRLPLLLLLLLLGRVTGTRGRWRRLRKKVFDPTKDRK